MQMQRAATTIPGVAEMLAAAPPARPRVRRRQSLALLVWRVSLALVRSLIICDPLDGSTFLRKESSAAPAT